MDEVSPQSMGQGTREIRTQVQGITSREMWALQPNQRCMGQPTGMTFATTKDGVLPEILRQGAKLGPRTTLQVAGNDTEARSCQILDIGKGCNLVDELMGLKQQGSAEQLEHRVHRHYT